MNIVGETGVALLNPFFNLWNSFVETIPGLIGAIIVLIVGYLVGWIIGLVVKNILERLKLDHLAVERTTLDKVIGKFQLSRFLGLIVKWFIFVLFLTPAASLVKLTALSDFLVKAALWIPNLIGAILVALVGLIAADYVYSKVHEVKAKSSGIIASTLRAVIIIFTLIISLSQLGIDVSIAQNSFLIILAGIMLALAIGFGLALKDEVKPVIRNLKGKL